MTKKKAKALALEKLEYCTRISLSARDDLRSLPFSIYRQVKKLWNHCPLCQLFCIENPEDGKHCGGCPLTPPSCNDRSDEALQNNITILQAWKPEE